MEKECNRQFGCWCNLFVFLFVYFGTLQRCDTASISLNASYTSVIYYCRKYYECNEPFETYSGASSTCSCHPACNLFHDCCYDNKAYNVHVNQTNVISPSLLPSISEYKDFFQCTTDVIENERYWMISKCPPSWPAESNHCESTVDSQRIVGNFKDISSIPVVSIDGITYRNIYCAMCHGLATDTLTPWSLQADCPWDVFPRGSYPNLTEKVSRLVDLCYTVTFRPPADHPFHLSTVIPCRKPSLDIIDVCTATEVDEDMKNNCAAVNAPIDVLGFQFKNRDCAECYFAGRESLSFVDWCFESPLPPTSIFYNYDSYSPDSYDFSLPMISAVPISIILNFGGQSGEVTVTREGYEIEKTAVECAAGKVFDPTSSNCVPLICPRGYDLVGMKCLQYHVPQDNVTSCDSVFFVIRVSVTQSSLNYCLEDVESFLQCTPGIPIIIENLLQQSGYSCTSSSNITEFAFETNVTSSVEIIEKLFSPSKLQETSSKDNQNQCNLIDIIDISAFCSSSKYFLNCDKILLNDYIWSFLDNSTAQMMIENSSAIWNISNARFQHRLRYSDEGNLVGTTSIERCTSCPLVTVPASLFQPDKIDSSTLVYTINQSIRLSPGMYNLDLHGNITVCNFLESSGITTFFPQYSAAQSILSTIGISLSINALSFSLLTYSVFPSRRTNIASILIMTLCACLIIAQSCLVFAGIAVSSVLVCSLLSGTGHLFWLVSFATTSILGFTLAKTFSLRNQTVRRHKLSMNIIAKYLLRCFAIPSIISGTLWILYLYDGEGLGITYGDPTGCWIGGPRVNLYAFGIPVAVTLSINMGAFVHVVVSLFIQHRRSGRIKKTGPESNIRELVIYIKIFVILGLSWITGFVASAANVDVLWYLFIILTSLQGVFIFMAFTFKSEIWELWRKKVAPSYPHLLQISRKKVQRRPTETSTL